MSTTIESEVDQVVRDMLSRDELFTALDVSNKVKEVFPFARHREVRDLVRAMFSTHIEPAGWDRTEITVNLTDGTTAQALLYHPLADSWDLDNKYDAQKRQQSSVMIKHGTVPTTVVSPAPVAAPLPAPIPSPAVVPASAVASAKDAWAALFDSQPSLFPRK